MYPVAIVSHRPQKSPNCISLHCIRLQKKPPVLQIVSGCSCIRLHLYPLQLYLIVSEGGLVLVSVYPVAIVSRCRVDNCISKTPCFSFCIRLQLYPVAIVSVAIATRTCCNCISTIRGVCRTPARFTFSKIFELRGCAFRFLILEI